MKDSMVFYRSFYEALKGLPDSDRLAIYDAIFSYGLDLKEVELSGIPAVIWKLVKPNIEANIRRYENGKKGAEVKQNQSKSKAKIKQSKSKPKPNKDKDVDVDKDKDGNENFDNDVYLKFDHLKITKSENEKILKRGYSQNQIDKVYLKIQNYRDNKKYKSLYLTALDWIERDNLSQSNGTQTSSTDTKNYKSL